MFELKIAWWEFALRGAAVYIVLLAMVRISGKRTVGQFSPFDLLVIMLLAQAVAGSLTAGDESLTGGFIAAAALMICNFLVDVVTTYSQKAEKILEGYEVMLGRNGKIFHDVMKKNRISQSAIDHALRAENMSLHDMAYAILEADGSISLVKKKPSGRRRPRKRSVRSLIKGGAFQSQ